MLDIKFIRTFPEEVKKNIERRRVKGVDIDEILDLDKVRLKTLQFLETNKAIRNNLTEKIPQASDSAEREKLLKQASDLKLDIKKLEEDLKVLEGNINEKLLYVPNMLGKDVPDGIGDPDHVELVAWIPGQGYLSPDKLGKGMNSAQYMPKLAFKGKDHLELGKMHDIIDVEQSALTSGTRFAYLKNDAVLLQDALYSLLKKKLLSEGFHPIVVPDLVKERVLIGSSHFPEQRDQVYEIKNDFVEENQTLFLDGSSEPALFAYFMDKTVDKNTLPYKMFAYSSCFRSEVGSWGKDVRGIKRVHQFDKLEMDIVTTEDKSAETMEYLRGINEWLMQTLQLPYRIIFKCAGDCGYSATHRQYDLEGWLPSQGEFVELGSNTNAVDFQSRRLNIRYKDGTTLRYAHTVNDTGIPMGRMLITILDNYQKEDGRIEIPDALQESMGKSVIGK